LHVVRKQWQELDILTFATNLTYAEFLGHVAMKYLPSIMRMIKKIRMCLSCLQMWHADDLHECMQPKALEIEANKCVVCTENDYNVLTLPCKHVCMCRSCVDIVHDYDNICPLCQSPIESEMIVYLG